MALQFYIHLLPFAPKKMGFWVQKWKILKFPKFSIRLISEALEALSCFPKGKKMFVSREELQTVILSTEQPLCHVGEPRYGPPKFFGGKPKIPENAFLPFEFILCLYSPKWYSEAPTHRKWKHILQWIILGYLVGNNSFLAKILNKIKGQKQENPVWHLGPMGGSQFILYVHKIDEDEKFIYAQELTIKDMILTFQSMLNSHLHNPKTPKMVKIGLE